MTTDKQKELAKKAARKEIEAQAGEVHQGLVQRFNARLHRMHWTVLLGLVLIGWPIDLLMNTVLHGLNVFAGAGAILDSILGPIDAFLVVVMPSTGIKELARRFWLRMRAKGWFKWIDRKLFGGGPHLVQDIDTE
jgi:F0F1-type ATP synthase assembly protein I